MYGELKNVLPSSVQKTQLPERSRKVAHYLGGGMGSIMKKCINFVHPKSPWHRVCTKAMVTSEGSYVYGELKNCIALVGAENPLTSAGRKVARYMGGGMGSRMEKCKISCTPIHHGTVFAIKAMVTS